MSIENNLASIAKSLEAIALALTNSKQGKLDLAPMPPAPAAPAAPMPTAPAAPMPPAPAAPAAPMPLAPAVSVPPAPAAATGRPFNDAKTLMTYVMDRYRAYGPIKGAMIQTVLGELNCRNINEVQAAQYDEFYSKVEAIANV